MASFEIMYYDLKQETLKELMKFLGIESLEEGNYDITPLAIIWKEDK